MKAVCMNCEVVFLCVSNVRLSKVACPQCRGKINSYHTKMANEADAWLFKHRIASFTEQANQVKKQAEKDFNMKHTCRMLTPGDNSPCKHYIRPNDPTDPGFCRQPTQFLCMEAMKHKLPSISYSRLTDFIHCKRRYYHSVIEGIDL